MKMGAATLIIRSFCPSPLITTGDTQPLAALRDTGSGQPTAARRLRTPEPVIRPRQAPPAAGAAVRRRQRQGRADANPYARGTTPSRNGTSKHFSCITGPWPK